jgi:acetyl-CoA carboxylase biotin carboxylase subunit
VEVQILGDGSRFVHLGDRDCTMQRRSQKIIEEAPAPLLPDAVRDRIRDSSVALARACGYSGVGTVEFLYDPAREEAAFIEMNTRLQVEHPVTEMITGLDLVAEQLRIADGEPLGWTQDDIMLTGHAFECRINAEDPARGFFPSPGQITKLTWPEGPVRDEAIELMATALSQLTVEGIATTAGLQQTLFGSPELARVEHYTTFIETAPGILEVTT